MLEEIKDFSARHTKTFLWGMGAGAAIVSAIYSPIYQRNQKAFEFVNGGLQKAHRRNLALEKILHDKGARFDYAQIDRDMQKNDGAEP